MDHWTPTRCHAAKQLYGRASRVALAEWIAERDYDVFYLKQAQRAISALLSTDVDTAIGQETQLMCDLGMLRRVPDGRRVYFVPIQASPHWTALEAINRALPSAQGIGRPPYRTSDPVTRARAFNQGLR